MIFKYEGQLESEPRVRLRAGGGGGQFLGQSKINQEIVRTPGLRRKEREL